MKYAQRIHYMAYSDEDNYKLLLEYLEKHRDMLDELALFTECYHHGNHPLDDFQKVCDILKVRIQDLKARGFKNVGVNMLDTIGHIDEGYSVFEPSPFQHITDRFGNVSKSCICPNDPQFKEYITRKYQMLAKTDPDFIWVDDDIKIFYNGVTFGCFCDNCVARFNGVHHSHFTKEELIEKLNDPNEKMLRGFWVSRVAHLIGEVLATIKDAVYSVHPDMPLGFMTQKQSWSTYHGCDFDLWFNQLSASRGRPGEGFYFDDTPQNVYVKALETARQMEEYPAIVTDIQYEIENFPYHKLQKSATIVDTECKLAIVHGMNGVLGNIMRIDKAVDYRDVEKIADAIHASKPILDSACEYAKDGFTYGFYPAISAKYDAVKPLREGDNFFASYEGTDSDVTEVYALGMIGVPLSMNYKKASGVILRGNLVDGYNDTELKDFLSRGVIVDGLALKRLYERGFGEYTGVKITGEYVDGVCEKFTDDEVNGEFAGEERDTRIAFWPKPAYSLEPLSDKTRAVCNLIDYNGNTRGACVTLYENELGGRVCVLGYSAFRSLYSVAKYSQIQNITDYLLKGQRPVKINECCKASVVTRACDSGILCGITSLGVDILKDLQIEFKGKKQVFEICADGEKALEVVSQSNDATVCKINNVNPFETKVLIAK